MRNLDVKWRLAGFVGILLLLLVGSGLAGLNGMRRANNSLADVYNSEVLPLKELREMETLFQSTLVGSIDKVLFEQVSWEDGLKKVEQTKTELEQKWAGLQATAKSNSNAADNWLTPATSLIASSEGVSTELIALLKKHDENGLDAITDAKLYPLADEYKKTINNLVKNRLEAVKHEFDESQQRYNTFKETFLLVMVVALCISMGASYLLIKSIDHPLSLITAAMKNVMQGELSHRLAYGRHDEFGLLIKGFNQMSDYLADLVAQIQRSGIQVTSSITELAATNKQQEVTANEHAATSSEIAASTTEIALTGTNLLTTMKKINSLTKNAAFAASEGHAGLEDIDRTMVKMEEATGSIVTKLQILNEKAGNIAGVVQTINKVADQTNLLSLNAAIEAEKAGEYGAGFAVVATEIRRLADQTAVATFEIEQMVQEVQTAISAAVMGIDKFAVDAHHSVEEVRKTGDQLRGVIEQVEILNPQVGTLTEGIEAQTLGAKQISEAINQLNEAAQQTAESLTQTSSTISQLHHAAVGLQEAAARFKVRSEGNHAASPV
ncbi:MAG: hypothetical protein A2521_00425 [Deltaproteobacteria bacterium RIFOXYD12_FULL_57_12]|nr:MAG: hypothetical protein A2521_00425 [Deltaproteobacteria bacterium RIFOXYD12_FULL_57_12]